jgi:putative phage-type endonuclease
MEEVSFSLESNSEYSAQLAAAALDMLVAREYQVDGGDDDDDGHRILAEVTAQILDQICADPLFAAQSKDRARITQEIQVLLANTIEQEYPMKCIEAKIQALRNRPQPVQRTPAWYSFRHNLLTASDAHKIFRSQASRNEIIFNKCQPLEIDEVRKIHLTKSVNVDNPMHWGQKYEPVSIRLYEQKFGTRIGDFGCLAHANYSFIGASPDGINILASSPLFGRMLEIKNVVSREITGIPKKEYWIQMQLQMEVCDLDECDFLETKFTEFENGAEFRTHQKNHPESEVGRMMYFTKPDLTPFYLPYPAELADSESAAATAWEEEMFAEYTGRSHAYQFISFLYWKLEVFSCVLVKRDKAWFRAHLPQMEQIWKTIEEERISGKYLQRRPQSRKPRNKKDDAPLLSKCYLHVRKV